MNNMKPIRKVWNQDTDLFFFENFYELMWTKLTIAVEAKSQGIYLKKKLLLANYWLHGKLIIWGLLMSNKRGVNVLKDHFPL